MLKAGVTGLNGIVPKAEGRPRWWTAEGVAAPQIGSGGNMGGVNHMALEEFGGSGVFQGSLGKRRRKQVEGVRQGLRSRGCRAGGPRIFPKASSSGPAPDTPPSSIPPAPTPQRTTFSPGVLRAGSIRTPSSSIPSSSTFIDESNCTHQKNKSDHRSLCNTLKWKGQTPCPGS